MSKNKVTVSAPGKLMLFGEHAVIYGRPCIVTAVDSRMKVTIEKRTSDELIVNAPEVDVLLYRKNMSVLGKGKIPAGVKFIEFAVKNFKKKFGMPGGLKITTKSDFSSKFGFGSSSAVTVAVIKGAAEILGIKLTNKELFKLSYKTVLEVQGVGSGFDLAAAIWGGTLYFVAGGRKIIPIKTGKLPLIVGYTGIKADTSTLVKEVALLYKKDKKVTEKIFDTMGAISESARILLTKKNYKRLGELATLNQALLESLGVSTKKLDKLISSSNKAGALGAKLSGAGGGDCMIAFIDSKTKNKAVSAIRKAKGTVLDVRTGAMGVRIEK